MTSARTLRKSFSLVLSLFLAAAMFAGCKKKTSEDYIKGKAAYDVKDYKEAARHFSIAAQQGDADAQCMLGKCYSQGIGVELNYSEAAKWFRKAADKGNAEAQFRLGNFCYGNGEGVDRDLNEAAKWLKKAADQNYAKAQFGFATFLASGLGVKADKEKADSLFKKAIPALHKEVDQGDAEAALFLCLHYATKGKDAPELNSLVEKTMEMANSGNAEAQFMLGTIYLSGIGVRMDQEEGIMWIRKAVDNGYKRGQKALDLLDQD